MSHLVKRKVVAGFFILVGLAVALASLADVAAKLLAAERQRTGKTVAEILSDAGLLLDSAEQKALEDLASGV